MLTETFEQVLGAAQVQGSLTPVWRKFVVTRFFVPIVRGSASDPASVSLRLPAPGKSGAAAILISEQRDLVAGGEGEAVASLSGADVIDLLKPEASILVALGSGTFTIDRDKVEWLRKGIETSRARAAAKAREGVPSAPAIPAPAAPKYPGTPVQRNQRGVLDVSALQPRSVSLPKLGLEFFVPGAWIESAMSGGLRWRDPASSTVVEACGVHRPGVTLAQWQQARAALVQHERRTLTQDGEPYPLDGEGWHSRIKGSATEFTGTFPGDEAESRYLVACIVIEGTAVTITIRARADDFEQQRQIYKWLLGRVDIRAEAAIEQGPSLRADIETFNPGVFGNSMAGRIGRMRAMAYSFPIFGAAFLAVLVGMLLFHNSPVLAGASVLLIMVFAIYTSVRLLVLRLHDVNLSGKWILGFLLLMGIGGATRNAIMILVVSALFWLAMVVIVYLMPGTDGDNAYGPPPGPNTPLVKAGAWLCIVLNLIGLIGGATGGRQGADALQAAIAGNRGAGAGQPAPARVQSGAPSLPLRPFAVASDFQVEVPGVPRQVPIADDFGPGVQVRQFQLNANSSVYVMQYLYFGRAQVDQAGIMERLKAGVLGQDDAQLISDELILVNTYKGREVKVKLPGNLIRAARYVIARDKICVAMIFTSGDPAGLARADEYLATFTVN